MLSVVFVVFCAWSKWVLLLRVGMIKKGLREHGVWTWETNFVVHPAALNRRVYRSSVLRVICEQAEAACVCAPPSLWSVFYCYCSFPATATATATAPVHVHGRVLVHFHVWV